MANTINSIQCFITGTGLFTPAESISNDELVAAFNQRIDRNGAAPDEDISKRYSSTAFIEKASGIQRRHVVNKSGIIDADVLHPLFQERDNNALSLQAEMAVDAARQALNNANKSSSDVDIVIVACSNMQRAYPAISIEVQAALDIQGFAYDMNVACSSATFAINNAVGAIQSGQAKTVLVINPEICSGHLDFSDRDCHFIFGDACTAMVIEAHEVIDNSKDSPNFEILGCQLATQFSNNIRNNFGFLNRCSPEGVGQRDKLFEQNGRQVFKEVCPMAAKHIQQHCDTVEIAVADVKRLWLHQANLSMNQLIAKKVLGRPATEEEAPVILDEYANTSSAGSVIAFHLYNGDFKRGDVGVICSFGAGYSIGSVVIKAA